MISRLINNEEKASRFINIISHYDDETLLDRSGKLIKIIRIDGLDYVTQSQLSLDSYKERFNNILKNLSSEFSIQCWDIRRKVSEYPAGSFKSDYANKLNERYCKSIDDSNLYRNELYMAIMTKPTGTHFAKGLAFIAKCFEEEDKASIGLALTNQYRLLTEVTQKMMSAMSDYGCELLTVYRDRDCQLSAPLAFVSQLINFKDDTVSMPSQDVASLLPRKQILFNKRVGTVELRSANGKSRYAAILAIKGYTHKTSQGMLDELSKLKCEYIISQSFRFLPKNKSMKLLRDHQQDMLQSKDESISLTVQLDDTMDETASGKVAVGLHHFSLACYADSNEELNENISKIESCLSDIDIACVRETLASECVFWSQLPGNYYYSLRSAHITTINFAGLASFHNYHQGKLNGSHWGEAITVLETLAGTPYYFNFHHKDVGNFLVYGSMGSGKSLLIGFLMALSTKYGGKRVFFDKDRGLEILVSALDGVYEDIKPGRPSGFNPLHLDDTPENRSFLFSLLGKILTSDGSVLSAADKEMIVSAITGIYRMPKESRQFRDMASFFGVKKPGSLRSRFDLWHSDGPYSWVFDNPSDTLSLDADALGFDIGSILSDVTTKTPILMYMIHRIGQAMEGHRGIIFFDEGWLALQDPYFRNFINDCSRTLRKKDVVFGLATQSASDTVNSELSKSINASARTKIFFPDPAADKAIYIEHFGLSEHQYELVKTLPDHLYYFLLLHGHGVNSESVVVRAKLENMQEDVAVISGREKNLTIFDQVRSEFGNDPKIWLREYLKRVGGYYA